MILASLQVYLIGLTWCGAGHSIDFILDSRLGLVAGSLITLRIPNQTF